MYYYGPPHMAEQKQDDQLEHVDHHFKLVNTSYLVVILYTDKKDKQADVSKYNLFRFFSCLSLKMYIWVDLERVGVGRNPLSRGNGQIFLWNFSVCLLRSPCVQIIHGLYNFLEYHAILVVTPPSYAFQVAIPPVEHATHTIYAALLLRNYVCPVYRRKQVNILFPPHTHKSCDIFTRISSSCLLEKTVAYSLIPPTQLIWHVKGIFRSIFIS